MRIRVEIVCALLAAALLPSSPSLAASRPATLSFRHDAAAARATAGRASATSVPDGAGGLYISWADVRDGHGDIFLLRVDNTGAVVAGWPADGLRVCAAAGDQFESVVVPDGSNGAVVAWLDFRNDWQAPDGYAQRVNSAGVPQWTANGVKVLSNLFVNDASVIGDGTGGLVVAWSTDGILDKDIFAVRYNGAGALPIGWSATGNLVCDAGDDQTGPVLTAAGAGSTIIAWEDNRTSGTPHAYAQRLNASGAAQWTAQGIQLDASLTGASTPAICTDGASGAFVFWRDISSADQVVGQRVNSAGAAQWAAGGLSVAGSSTKYSGLQCASDGALGAIVTWEEFVTSVQGIRAQRVDAAGAPQWGVLGVSIVSLTNASATLQDIVADGTGAAYFIWEDSRNSTSPADGSDLYAQRVTAAGSAAWTANGVAVCTGTGTQSQPTGAPDGSGGVLFAWRDTRTLDTDIYAQRYNAAGAAQLAANGLAVFSNPGVQVGDFVLQSDDGGALVFWNERRGGQWDIRARKLDATGAYAGPSLAVCAATGNQFMNAVIDDGAGGAIVAWADARGSGYDLYAQRLDINLAPQWLTNGVAICTAASDQQQARMVTDGSGGAIVAWQDDRNSGNSDVYAQRVSAAGAVQWAANGVAVCANLSAQQGAVIAPDGAGGAIIAWADSRTLFTPAVYAQRVNGAGAPQWTADGVSIGTFAMFSFVRVSDAVTAPSNSAVVLISEPVVNLLTGTITSVLHAQKVNASGAAQWGGSGATVCDVSSLCSHERIVEDGAGGAYVAWSDGRTGVFDIYMQRVDAAGAVQWTANGNAVCTAANPQLLDGLTRDGGGDAYLAWEDERSGEADVYAQRLSSAGAAQWAADGVVVCSATRGQYFSSLAPYKTAAPTRLYVAWTDNRLGNARYVEAQRLGTNGVAQWTSNGVTAVALSAVSAAAEPGRVRLVWHASEAVTATIYRRTDAQDWLRVGEARSDGSGQIAFEDRDVLPGIEYTYRLGYLESGQERFAGQVSVRIPLGFQLSIDDVRPNPAAGPFAVWFAVPTSAEPKLEVFDLAGRRVYLHDFRAAMGPGRYGVTLSDFRAAPGVYVIRLTHAGRAVTSRVAVRR